MFLHPLSFDKIGADDVVCSSLGLNELPVLSGIHWIRSEMFDTTFD
jgi:hypothetical protein